MKAALWTSYGKPETSLEVVELPKPSPNNKQILVKVHKSTITLGDCEIRGSYLPLWTRIPLKLVHGIFKPRGTKILGQECAGEIIEVGNEVTKFSVGDRIVATTGISLGGHAEYIILNENSSTGIMKKIPNNVSFQDATTLPVGGINALYFIRLTNLQQGDKILINGAGGSIGSYAIQLAKLRGAEITAIDVESKFEMIQSQGADHCIDFTTEDVTSKEIEYDVIFDIVGKLSLRKSRKILKENGLYISANPKPNTMIRSKFISKFSDKTYIAGIASGEGKLLEELLEMLSNEIIIPYIDREFSLDEVIEAHQYVERNEKKGHVIINMD